MFAKAALYTAKQYYNTIIPIIALKCHWWRWSRHEGVGDLCNRWKIVRYSRSLSILTMIIHS